MSFYGAEGIPLFKVSVESMQVFSHTHTHSRARALLKVHSFHFESLVGDPYIMSLILQPFVT